MTDQLLVFSLPVGASVGMVLFRRFPKAVQLRKLEEEER